MIDEWLNESGWLENICLKRKKDDKRRNWKEVERDLFYSNINHYFVEYGESEEEEEISDVEIVDVFASPAKYPCHPYYSYEYLAYERSDSK